MSTSELDKQVAKIILAGLKQGISEASALQKAGMLLTPEIKIGIGVTALRDIAELLRNMPPQQIIQPGVPMSGADMLRGAAAWIDEIADNNEKALKGQGS